MKTRYIALTLLALVALTLIVACNSAPSRPGNRFDQLNYQIYGTVVTDFNRDLATVAAWVYRDSTILPTAKVAFDGDSLRFNQPLFPFDSVYSFAADPATAFVGFDLPLVLRDSTRDPDTMFVSIPDTFTILTVEPPNRIVTGLQPVSVQWSGSDEADGYVLAAVRRNFAYTGYGWSQYVTSLSPAGTLPPDAFSLSPGPNPDTGWYYIFVYSYAGTPDSVLTEELLPVPMPSQLSDNINDEPWTGRFGAVVVGWRDSVHVVIQP